MSNSDSRIPNFLNKKYLEKVLQAHEKSETIQIINFDIRPPIIEESHHASLLLRADVNYSYHENVFNKRFIIKTMLLNEEIAKLMKNAEIYQREMIMYNRILPEYKKLLHSIHDSDQLYPNVFHIDLENSTMILEDLTEQEYKVVDRHLGMSTGHLDLLIPKIAKFHACSMILHAQGIETYSEFNKGITFSEHHRSFFESMISEIEQWPGYSYYVEKLNRIKNLLIPQGNDLFKNSYDNKHLNVLIHGDLHINNIMFKYDTNNKPLDAILVRSIL